MGPIRPSMMLMAMLRQVQSSGKFSPMARGEASAVADAVRQPAVEEGFLARAAFGEGDVAFALQRLHRAQQHGLAAPPARLQQAVERRQGDRKSTRLNSSH